MYIYESFSKACKQNASPRIFLSKEQKNIENVLINSKLLSIDQSFSKACRENSGKIFDLVRFDQDNLTNENFFIDSRR